MFKKAVVLFGVVILLTGLAACGNGNETPQPTEPEPVVPEPPAAERLLPGKIAIVTNSREPNAEVFLSAVNAIAGYGEDYEEYFIHWPWPAQFFREGELMIRILQSIADDPEVKVLIINQAVSGTNAAVEAFRKRRDDVFVIYVNPFNVPGGRAEVDPHSVLNYYNVITGNADLVLGTNFVSAGERMVSQAKAMGAETFVHYSHVFSVAHPPSVRLRDDIKEACEMLGIKFMDLCMSQRDHFYHLIQDIPRQIEAHGENTAFYANRYFSQHLELVIRNGGIYVEPAGTSPFDYFPRAFRLIGHRHDDPSEMFSTSELLEAIKTAAATAGMTGRLSTFAMSDNALFTFAAVEYGIKWMRGEVSKEKIDLEVLRQIMVDVIAEQTGVEGLGVNLTKHEFEGVVFSNFILAVQDYLTF